MFELQIRPAPASLAALGERVELHELTCGEVNQLKTTDALFAASLHIDGATWTSEEINALPGRFAGGLSHALRTVLAMHGLGIEEPTAPAKADSEGSESGEA